ncbi:2-oxo-hept-4-ene-1,7-dioate hydratase [Duganella radicis]|uniref:2-oxo-hepta-3-ene-1,7-dioic acid hydratase n=1 Tax=Duganella radicis TaxID=551988 RepID=A0A6L6PBK0_9BURK|nr:2-oxo-hepta-3-ene-1,7-dioic acid hydratase [Duganella radicis]MTV36019.1 2-oxo-hepta-3-ene-1,7-dioic acid hydratase [Duganella radicis]
MLDQTIINAAARRLHLAEQTRQPVRQISLDHPDITIADAYAIQREWIKLKLGEGRRVIGHKIGLTSRAMQMSSQIDEPDYGTLLDDMLFQDGSDIACERFIDPMIEVELAFILKHRLAGANLTMMDVLSATDYVIPAAEIIDARCHRIDPETKRPRKVMDTISDNAANVGIIMGGRPVKPMDLDLRWVAALLYRNGVIEETGVAAGVLNHPANGIAWLARKFAPFDVALEPGQIILAGSFTRPVKVRPGDTFHIDYGQLGAISARFV